MNHLRPESTGLFSRTGVRYEVACDVVGAVLSHFAHVIATESVSGEPGTQRKADAQRLMGDLRDIRDGLDPRDRASIEDVIERLAPLARYLYQDAQEGTQEARGAAQFDQTNASLGMDGQAASIDDLAVQAQIIRGELSSNEAAALYRGRIGP